MSTNTRMKSGTQEAADKGHALNRAVRSSAIWWGAVIAYVAATSYGLGYGICAVSPGFSTCVLPRGGVILTGLAALIVWTLCALAIALVVVKTGWWQRRLGTGRKLLGAIAATVQRSPSRSADERREVNEPGALAHPATRAETHR
jgi:hypothetical protein